MTEAFNSFFVNIGPKLADKIDIINKKTFNAYLTLWFCRFDYGNEDN